jgi:SAM-dependent methyltransferase
VITHERIPDFYDWLSRYVQFSNWVAYRDRYAAFTMHKRLRVPAGSGSHCGPTAGLEYVNDHLLEVAGLPPEPHVLDAGCGFGGTVFHWQSRIGGRYDGLTLSRVQRCIAQREAERRGVADVCRFHLQSYDAALPADFDAVVAIESLIHSADLAWTIPNLAKALRPGGLLLILDDMATGALDRLRPAEAALLARHWGCAPYPREEDYRDGLARAGLILLHEEDLSGLMLPRDEEVLDRLEKTYSRLYRSIPLPPVRTVVSAFLGGTALERLHGSGEVHYRLFVAGNPDPLEA